MNAKKAKKIKTKSAGGATRLKPRFETTLVQLAYRLESLILDELEVATSDSFMIPVSKIEASFEDTKKVLERFKHDWRIHSFEPLQQEDHWSTTHWNIETTKEFFVERNSARDLHFDPQTGLLSYGGRSERLSPGGMMYRLCKLIFSKPRGHIVQKVEIDNVVNYSTRSTYDAVRRINEAAERLGVAKPLRWKRGSIRVD